jgi:hypothetical protein
MSYGILDQQPFRQVFEKINGRQLCGVCREKRAIFYDKDQKSDSFSNLLPGFSSSTVNLPLDVLIVAEAHGGGRIKDFRQQKDLEFEVNNIAQYYLESKLERFHQQEVRSLLNILDKSKVKWVLTDLIKCFVHQDYKENREIAIKYCSEYLNEQIESFQPKQIIVLGKTVANKYFRLNRLNHGDMKFIKTRNGTSKLIYSIFPSRNTADLWVANDAWKPVLRAMDLNQNSERPNVILL